MSLKHLGTSESWDAEIYQGIYLSIVRCLETFKSHANLEATFVDHTNDIILREDRTLEMSCTVGFLFGPAPLG